MAKIGLCTNCGAPLDPGEPGGCCAACLLKLAVSPSSLPLVPGADGVPAQPGERIGPYRILAAIGEGGMGIVYLAEQEGSLRRRVALKLIKMGMNARQIVARFESERRVMAIMDHPGIASVFDAGTAPDGRPYFVMEYVPGLPITDYCDQHRLSTRARLALFAQVCAAVQHAHQKGVIHLDLKPTNVLVMEQDGAPAPKVIDFGVAKAIELRKSEETLFTEHGLLVGTPEYMSPEQASGNGRDLDTRTDIYSLGVLLYELLAGDLPFPTQALRRAGYDELRRIIREDEPPKPSVRLATLADAAAGIAGRRDTDIGSLGRELRGDLDWIVMKALEKDPVRRYASASEFAADIRRHLEDDPVLAGPPSATYRIRKFVRKHKAPVAAAAAILLALLGGLSVSTAMFVEAERARDQAARQRSEAERQRALAEAATAEAIQQRTVADSERKYADSARVTTVDMYARTAAALDKANRQRVEALRRAYVANIALAAASLQSFAPTEAVRRLRLADPSLRGWEWRHLFHRADPSLITLSAYGQFTRYPFLSSSFAFSRDGARVAWNTERTVQQWDSVSYRSLAIHGTRDLILALAPDARLMLTSASKEFTLKIVRPESQAVVASLAGHTSRPVHAAFSRDSRRVASVAADGIRIWDVPSGRSIATIHAREIRYVALAPDGSRVAAASGNDVQLWDSESGELERTFRGHTELVHALAFSPNGDRLASASHDKTIQIWHVRRGERTTLLQGHTGPVFAVAFSPDGTTLVSGGHDSTVRLWNCGEGHELLTWPGVAESRYVISVGFDSTGTRVFSGHSGGTFGGHVRVWEISSRALVSTSVGEQPHEPITFSADGRSLVAGSKDGSLHVRNLISGILRAVLRGHDAAVRTIALDPTGTRLVSGSVDGTVRVWDLLSDKTVLTLIGHTAEVNSVAFSRSGNEIMSVGRDRAARVWNSHSGRVLARLDLQSAANAALFSRDGAAIYLATGDPTLFPARHPTVQLWHWRTGRIVAVADGRNGGAVTAIALSPDGNELAVAGTGLLEVSIWNSQLNRKLGNLVGHSGPVSSLAFTPDGTRIITASWDGTARVWDAVRHETLLVLHNTPGEAVRGLAVSRDGSRVATLAGNRLYLWDTDSAFPLEVRDLVQRLFERFVFSGEVLTHLRSQNGLASDIRKAAIRLAEARGDSPGRLNRDSWEVVKRPTASATAYRLALRRAGVASQIAHWDPEVLNTLALARYRSGQYNGALETIAKASALRTGPSVYDLVVSVLARLQLRRLDDLEADLQRLIAFDDPDPDLKPLIQEATSLAQRLRALR